MKHALLLAIVAVGFGATAHRPLHAAHRAPAERVTSLFDGKTVKGWVKPDGQPVTAWQVVDGLLYKPRRGGTILSADDYGDGELRFEWKIAEGGNSGLKYRVKKFGDEWLGCEYQLLDDERHGNAKNPKTSCGALYALFAPNEEKHLKPAGEFNEGRVVTHGTHLEHWLNGKKIVAVDTNSSEWKERVAASKFSEAKGFGENPRGKIMLQDHGSEIWFRNITFRPAE